MSLKARGSLGWGGAGEELQDSPGRALRLRGDGTGAGEGDDGPGGAEVAPVTPQGLNLPPTSPRHRSHSGIPNPAVACSWTGSRPPFGCIPQPLQPLLLLCAIPWLLPRGFSHWKCPWLLHIQPGETNPSGSPDLRAHWLGYSKLNTTKSHFCASSHPCNFFTPRMMRNLCHSCPHPAGQN